MTLGRLFAIIGGHAQFENPKACNASSTGPKGISGFMCESASGA